MSAASAATTHWRLRGALPRRIEAHFTIPSYPGARRNGLDYALMPNADDMELGAMYCHGYPILDFSSQHTCGHPTVAHVQGQRVTMRTDGTIMLAPLYILCFTDVIPRNEQLCKLFLPAGDYMLTLEKRATQVQVWRLCPDGSKTYMLQYRGDQLARSGSCRCPLTRHYNFKQRL